VATSRYLDFDVLASINNMELLAQTVVEGFLLGLHRSPFRGFSVEFAEYRQYTPGDEVRFVDWRVYARSDRFYVKQYEEETNLACHLLVDASASMGFRGPDSPMSKLDYASSLAACLAYFMMRQRDSVSLTIFDSGIRTSLPARQRHSHLQHILAALDNCEAGNVTNVAAPMHDLAEGLKRRGMVVVISDLLDDPASVLSAFQHFRFQGHDVLALHVMDSAELQLDYDRMTEFIDSESGEKVLVSPAAVRSNYMDELERFLSAYEKGAARVRVDYKLFDTKTPLELALSEYLHKRSKRN
jgi:uncharacterized protein (DUF58 family)